MGNVLRLAAMLLALGAFGFAHAQTSLDGMPRVAQWTDLENGAGELPVNIWPACASQRANRIGIRVAFSNGTNAFAVYSGVGKLWNTSDFSPILPSSGSGFLATCDLHFLFDDKNVDLPMAFQSCSMAFASNFDLDRNEDFGSNFRADTAGWVQADFQTYCGDPLPPASVPTAGFWTLLAAGLSLALLGGLALRRRASVG